MVEQRNGRSYRARTRSANCWGIVAAAALAVITGGRVFAQDAPADVTLGGEVVMRLRSSAGGLTPQQRVGAIEDRLTRLLAIPGITPADVVVYTPAGKPPVVYALGRRLIEVDQQTAASAGSPGESLKLATGWAKKLQQLLPRVNYRPSNAPEPNVPANPPLTVTSDFSKVGGSLGRVYLRDKLIAVLRGPQPGGFTAVEYADLLGARLNVVAHRLGDSAADSVKIVSLTGFPIFGPVWILMGDRPMLIVDDSEASAAKMASPDLLAQSWSKNLRNVLTVTPPAAPAASATPAPADGMKPPAP